MVCGYANRRGGVGVVVPLGRVVTHGVVERLGDPTFFRATLLEDPHVAFLAQREHGAIAAGAIAKQSADVIGISNVFAQNADLTTAWAEAVHAARQRFGPLPVVGYGTGEALLAAQAAALDPIGPLRVWSAPR